MTAILIIHGLENIRPAGHWHRILTSQLRAAGHTVVYPQFPQPEAPVLEQWLAIVDTELQMLKEAGFTRVTVICHSLGCVTWMHYIETNTAPLEISKVLLVAPADPLLLTAAPTFQSIEFTPHLAERLHASCSDITLVASEADPWLPRGVDATYATPLNLVAKIFPGAGHISMSDGFGKWDGVFNWLNDPAAQLIKKSN